MLCGCVLCSISLANRGIHPNLVLLCIGKFQFSTCHADVSFLKAHHSPWLGRFTVILVPFAQFQILILTSKFSQSFVAPTRKLYGCVLYSSMQAIKKVLNRTEPKTKSCGNSFEMSSEFDNKTLIMLSIWWFHTNPHFSAFENVM